MGRCHPRPPMDAPAAWGIQFRDQPATVAGCVRAGDVHADLCDSDVRAGLPHAPLLLRESAHPVPAPCKDGDAGVAVGEAVPRSYTIGLSWSAAAQAGCQPKAVCSCDALRRRREAKLRGRGYERDPLRLNRSAGLLTSVQSRQSRQSGAPHETGETEHIEPGSTANSPRERACAWVGCEYDRH